MYLEFYGLREKPFTLTPDPQYLYLSEGHRTAIESLLYGIHQREGFMVLTGDIGTGKTMICRTILGKLDKSVKSAVIFNSFLTEDELLESILLDFGFTSKGKTRKERIDGLNRVLIHFLSRGENAVLIIDEAQNLSIPVLEQIRMLSNLETEKEKMLQIVLLGQLELEKKLQSPELRQLNQRIAIRQHLLPLTRLEVERYIGQRLTVAGSQGTIPFSKSAFNEIYRFSGGIPRLINLLCERALLAGYVAQTFHIDKDILAKAEKSLLGKDMRKEASLFGSLPKRLHPLQIASLMIFLFFVCLLILWGQKYLPYLQTTKTFIGDRIQTLQSRILKEPPSASFQISPEGNSGADTRETKDPGDSKGTLEERTP